MQHNRKCTAMSAKLTGMSNKHRRKPAYGDVGLETV
jgi:hypothetical protein